MVMMKASVSAVLRMIIAISAGMGLVSSSFPKLVFFFIARFQTLFATLSRHLAVSSFIDLLVSFLHLYLYLYLFCFFDGHMT